MYNFIAQNKNTMKRYHVNILLGLFSLFLAHSVYGQSLGENYVRESIFLEGFSSSPVTDYDFARATVTYYDGLGELHPISPGLGGGNFGQIQFGSTYNNTVFRESFSYDENGNPEIITRGNINNQAIQYISLSYDGNRIASLNESKQSEGLFPEIPSIAKGDYETGWTYDANGNRTGDPSRGVTSITYNHINQPVVFTFSDGSTLTNTYRSDGTHTGYTEKSAYISSLSDGGLGNGFSLNFVNYIGDFETKGISPTRVYVDGGYVDLYNWGDSTVYHYYVSDNQGSVRAVIDETGTLVQATDYSAYGVPSSRYAGTADNNRKHLGLEWQPMKGLYGYYNNARFRDAMLAGTFHQQDPLAEKYYPFSPYSYGMNNPLRYTDQTGMFSYEWQANVARSIQKLNPTQYLSDVNYDNTKNGIYKYSFNTVSKNDEGYVFTTHYGVSRDIANNIQDVGDAMILSGFATSLTVVGAEVGFTMMTIGNVLSFSSGFIGLGVNLLNSEYMNSSIDLFSVSGNLAQDYFLNKFIPGRDLGSRLLRKSAEVKLTIIENVVEDVMMLDKGNEKDNNEEDKHAEKTY